MEVKGPHYHPIYFTWKWKGLIITQYTLHRSESAFSSPNILYMEVKGPNHHPIYSTWKWKGLIFTKYTLHGSERALSSPNIFYMEVKGPNHHPIYSTWKWKGLIITQYTLLSTTKNLPIYSSQLNFFFLSMSLLVAAHASKILCLSPWQLCHLHKFLKESTIDTSCL